VRRFLVALMCLVPAVVLAQGVDDVGGKPRASKPSPETASAPAAVSGSASFTGSESTMSPRINRPASPHTTCSTTGSGNYQYRIVPFVSGSGGSLTLTIDPGTCDGTISSWIYPTFHTAFNPADVCSGFVWGPGNSPSAGSNTMGPFSVTPSTSMVMVIGAVNNPTVTCGPVAYSIAGATNVPTMTEWGALVLALVLAGTGVWMLPRRRRHQATAA